jgi:hypothetical protein
VRVERCCCGGLVVDILVVLRMNSDGFAVAFGRGSNGGDIDRPPAQIYYCGRRLGQCRCGSCDGRCGPTNGCPCNSCKQLTLSDSVLKLDDFIKCPRGHQIALSSRTSGWNCDGRREEGGCRGGGGTTERARWRCVEESCDFDYCGECYSYRLAKILANKFVVNCEGAKAAKSYDWFHTQTERHYCGRNVGREKYANECRDCDGRCGPSSGCQCRACFLLDNPQFLSPSSLRLNSRPIDRTTQYSGTERSFSIEATATCRPYLNGDFYSGAFCDGQRQGLGTYSLRIGPRSSSSSPLYLEYPGEWNENQLIRYLSYQNVWWRCLSPVSVPLNPPPEDSSRPSFDINLLKTAEYLCLGSYFFLKFSKQMISLQEYEPSPLPIAPGDLIGGVATGVWAAQALVFTLRFSCDFSEVESGNIVHIPSGTVVLTFGSQGNSSSSSSEGSIPQQEYHPLPVSQQLFQHS